MTDGFSVFPTAKNRDGTADSPEDILWTVKGDWDDIARLLENPHGWVKHEKGNAPSGRLVELPAEQRASLYFVYPPQVGPSRGPCSNVVIQGTNLSDVIMVRGIAQAPPHTDAPGLTPSDITNDNVTVTIRPDDDLAFFHFPIVGEPATRLDVLSLLVQHPPAIVGAIEATDRAAKVTYNVHTENGSQSLETWNGARDRTRYSELPVKVRLVLSEGDLGGFRMIVQPPGDQPLSAVPGSGSPVNPPCLKGAAHLVSQQPDGHGNMVWTYLLDTGQYVIYYTAAVDPGDA